MGINRSCYVLTHGMPTSDAIYSTTTELFPVKFSKTQ
ncbi:hypothetical protein T4A_12862 [Trichinella pseudospiralis]|uniref:Uncharacterized protein n=1 Tax=Trichinella pseudospiralis TaxID=6337 RepID=A0A0V1C785_TRIPS|nr:hypothetical protein T4A_12862 [Trichinella pseudospiralis]